mgnify:CR=1 FL=1
MVKKKKDENHPKEKVVRNDVKQRKEDNKNTDFTCIKSSWKSFCKNNLPNLSVMGYEKIG